jgi:hypothetical protein
MFLGEGFRRRNGRGAKAGTAQEWAQRRLARGRTGMNGYQIFAAYRSAAS